MIKPLLLLHGALYTEREFDPLISHLAGTFNPLRLNFRGHGGDPMPDEPLTMPMFARQVIDLLDRENIERADIFGFSMGGYVGLHLARRMPERVGRVMTLGTKLQWNPETAAREIRMLDPVRIREKVPAFAETLKGRHGDAEWEHLLGKTAEMMTGLGNGDALTAEDFAAIETPVRLCLGDRDRMVGIDETLECYRSLPNGELAVLPGTPHPLEQVDTERLAREIISFVS